VDFFLAGRMAQIAAYGFGSSGIPPREALLRKISIDARQRLAMPRRVFGVKQGFIRELGDRHMRKQKGFTLIELVVVVMILGILAAVAAPKLLNTSSTAADNGLKQTLGVVRDAIERYAAEHAGKLPGDAGTEADLKDDLKPYLRGIFPKCPVALQDDTVKITTTAGAIHGEATETPTKSWHYNSGDGQFICNEQFKTKSDDNVKYDEL